MERIADYVIKKVNDAGAGNIFLINGRGILYLTDAVAKNKNIVPVSTYHEQGASYAAMAYASAKKNIAACLVSTGCAATNAITACLCAYQDNLPIIFISGNNPLAENTRHKKISIRTYGSQETDIISIVTPCTKYAVMLEDKETAALEIEKAIWISQHGRKGPVWIDIPLDVQNMRIDSEKVTHFSSSEKISVACVEEGARKIAEDLNCAERPLLLIGGGTKDFSNSVSEFVERIKIPVAFSPSACDVYGAANDLSVGAVGSIGGSRAGNFTVQNADYILALGTRLSSQMTGMKQAFARAAKITVVDIDENEHTKDGVHIGKIINADVSEILAQLSKEEISPVNLQWRNLCLHWKEKFSIRNEKFFENLREVDELDIYTLADILSEKLPPSATIITDAGFEELIIPSTIRFKAGQRCLFPAAQGAMGYAIPAILGAAAAGRKNIFCVVGDGSFMMNMQELGLISARNIPAKIFVINNNMYAVIRRRQRDIFRNRTIGNDPSDGLPAPNFQKIAAAAEIEYLKISTASSLAEMLPQILAQEKPLLVELICTPNQNYLHESYALNEKRKLVHRPIEDMSPFLDRETIRAEMIIKMLED